MMTQNGTTAKTLCAPIIHMLHAATEHISGVLKHLHFTLQSFYTQQLVGFRFVFTAASSQPTHLLYMCYTV